MSQVYQDHDVLLVPSSWQEPMTRVILEAMAVGLPTIASSVGGIPEIIKHNINGLLFSPWSKTDLSEKIQSVYADPESLAKSTINARHTIEQQFNLKRIVNTLENCLLILQNS